MGSRFVYEPLVSPFLENASQTLRDGFRQAHGYTGPGTPEITRLSPGGSAHITGPYDLSNRPWPDDTLYVLLYGKEGWNYVGATDTAGGPKFFSPPALAKHLCDQKLHKNFRDLRILASHSGSMYHEGGPTFAYELKEEMNKLGYDRISITGYTGAFADHGYAKRLVPGFSGYHYGLVPSPRAHKGITLENGLSHRASAFKVTYS